MPYISQRKRMNLENGYPPGTPGELNYAITKLADEFLRSGLGGYTGINEVIGVLECCKLEFYRRIAAPLEDEKMAENGDVYGV